MTHENDKHDPAGGALPQPSSRDLMGKQSVRATFKLSEKAIEAMSAVSVHLGIKQKSLFDHLIDDLNALELIANELRAQSQNIPSRVQKTYVLSRKTLASLERAAHEFQASRDALVEYSIQRLMPVIEQEKARHRRRKKLLQQIDAFVESGCELLAKAEKALGSEDPLYDQLEKAVHMLNHSRSVMTDFVRKGEIIENF
jgi:hypothetical protein